MNLFLNACFWSCLTNSCIHLFFVFDLVIFNQNIIKGLLHPKMKISLCFPHSQGILGVYDFLLSDKSNQSYIKNCPGYSTHCHCSRRVFLFNRLKYGYFSYKNPWIRYRRPLFTPWSCVRHILLWMHMLYLLFCGLLNRNNRRLQW